MTKNQIDYFNARENQRKNVVSEAQRQQEISIAQQNADTAAYNASTNAAAVAETARHNRELEVLQSQDIANQQIYRNSVTSETQRHNLAQETAAQRQLAETTRHNEQDEYNARFTAHESHDASTERAIAGMLGSWGSGALKLIAPVK